MPDILPHRIFEDNSWLYLSVIVNGLILQENFIPKSKNKDEEYEWDLNFGITEMQNIMRE